MSLQDSAAISDWHHVAHMHRLAIPAWFEQCAAARPDQLALATGTERLSYRDLDRFANRLAHELLTQPGLPGDRIGILARHDSSAVIATLAVLKAGRVAVVLNPADPRARLGQVIANAGATAIIADRENQALARALAASGLTVVEIEAAMRGGKVGPPNLPIDPDQLAFLIYTSGSTGEPKGVMRTHRQALQNALRMSQSIGIQSEDRIALVFTLGSEVGVTLTWTALLNGISLHPFSIPDSGIPAMQPWLQSHGITVLSATASIYRQLVRSVPDAAALATIRVLRLGSEETTSRDFEDFRDHFSKRCTLLLSFGSTECGTILHRRLSHFEEVEDGILAAGRAADGIDLFLVDEHGDPVQPGEAGEMIVRSTSLSDGYWNDPALTKSKFIDWPPGSGCRAFRSGDLALVGDDGLIRFAGRKDTQTKIGGYRVELREVEQALCGLKGVRQAAAIFSRSGERTEIVAFVAPERDMPKTTTELRRELAQSVPRQMIPSRFVFVDHVPIAPSGKVDRERLRQIMQGQAGGESEKMPETETETMLAGFWADVLGIPAIRRDDDFFELGGDSLMATVVSARVFEALEVEIHLGTLADHPVLGDLAAAIDNLRGRADAVLLPPLVAVDRDRPLPLSLNQQHSWNASQTVEGLKSHTASEGRVISGPLDRDILGDCMGKLAARHDLLRTAFPVIDGHPVQVVAPFASFDLPFVDLAGRPDATETAQRLLDEEKDRQFDLANGPLMYFTLIRIAPDEHWLLSTFHHILTDPWSWDIYFRELGQLYEARRRGDATSLDPLPIQYGDFAAWQQQILRRDSRAYQSALERWTPYLAGVPRGLALPFARARPLTGVDPRQGFLEWELEDEVSRRLDDLEAESGTSYFAVRIAAFAAALAAETGRTDFAIGTYQTHRNRVALHNVFGPFVYLVALRFRIDPQRSFRDWIAAVWQVVTAAEANGPIPLDSLNAGLSEQGHDPPEVKVIFNVLKNQVRAKFDGLELRKIASGMIGMPHGFNINLDQSRHVWSCAFDAGVYDPAKVDEFVGRYRDFLAAVAREPDVPMAQFLAARQSREKAKGWWPFRQVRKTG